MLGDLDHYLDVLDSLSSNLISQTVIPRGKLEFPEHASIDLQEEPSRILTTI